ncbi:MULTISPECIES: hypothetical protein [unclassified Streptomyces]|uniref:hypothetical protein n=1 Tax=unclassified Streptomyces TaxID=2593676 RepID=UPI002E327E12|nr:MULTISPECIES: hypothetical protein [unclassified Streptomyces]WUC68943.1 hypothetical protein OG861_32260 [Streptomyces sp. NBC_00539]
MHTVLVEITGVWPFTHEIVVVVEHSPTDTTDEELSVLVQTCGLGFGLPFSCTAEVVVAAEADEVMAGRTKAAAAAASTGSVRSSRQVGFTVTP